MPRKVCQDNIVTFNAYRKKDCIDLNVVEVEIRVLGTGTGT